MTAGPSFVPGVVLGGVGAGLAAGFELGDVEAGLAAGMGFDEGDCAVEGDPQAAIRNTATPAQAIRNVLMSVS